MKSDTFYGDFMIKLVQTLFSVFHRENMVNQIIRQSPYKFYHKIPMKSITLHTVFKLSKTISAYYGTKYFSSAFAENLL